MESLLRTLKALADETRLKMVIMLLEKDYCVGGLARHLNISKAAVSQHLKVLRESGLVVGEKRSYYVFYAVQKEQINGISRELEAIARQEYQTLFKDHGCRHDGSCGYGANLTEDHHQPKKCAGG
ncbi:ArsR/SmtB family transcription factor [Anoxynatronum buryatiense]|uniref:ArsR family transcriptional regulator n=1 Tax=Anoxynatronum buryatiense TaxID=489973 RepID=A0AA45WZ07_9CLOT|nr:metalloregulator ArsR/SmtB family transcription factor [Anoxynatronum buryatiense]SMP71155.1 ArsR family transcriptional regulator [Anoxynatronum buryatiense]